MIVEKKSPYFKELAAVQIQPGHFVKVSILQTNNFDSLSHLAWQICAWEHDGGQRRTLSECCRSSRKPLYITRSKQVKAFSTTVHILKTSILSSRLLKTASGQRSLCVLLGRYTAPVSCNLLNNEFQSARVPEQIAPMYLRYWGVAHSFGDCMCGKADLNWNISITSLKTQKENFESELPATGCPGFKYLNTSISHKKTFAKCPSIPAFSFTRFVQNQL